MTHDSLVVTARIVGSPESIALVRGVEDANRAAAKKAFDEMAGDDARLHWVASTSIGR